MKHPPPPPDRESLLQLPKAQLVDMMLRLLDQIQMLTERIEQLEQRRATGSQTSSKPPSTDLLTKPEQTLEADPSERECRVHLNCVMSIYAQAIKWKMHHSDRRIDA